MYVHVGRIMCMNESIVMCVYDGLTGGMHACMPICIHAIMHACVPECMSRV